MAHTPPDDERDPEVEKGHAVSDMWAGLAMIAYGAHRWLASHTKEAEEYAEGIHRAHNASREPSSAPQRPRRGPTRVGGRS